MRQRITASGLFALVTVLSPAGVAWGAATIPPGRQHLLTIEGENTVTFVPQAGLPPFQIEYQARVEYIIDTRFGKDSRAATEKTKPSADGPPAEKPPARPKAASNRSKARKAEAPAPKANGAVDLSLHSSEISFRQGGRPILETKVSRSRFQGRLQPDSPILSVTANDAPPMLQDILKRFDVIAATMAIDDNHQVIGRKYRFEGPQRAVTETILSIHAPIPKGVDTWQAPTQLAMGHGQTAKGKLTFEKEKVKASDVKPGGPIKVKVSGVLKAEGAIAGRFIKDGTYTVSGEQTYDPHTNEWTSSRWSVAIDNELANQAGQTVARAKGRMTVKSRALDGPGSSKVEVPAPKL